MSLHHVEKGQRDFPWLRLVNVYGPTETGVPWIVDLGPLGDPWSLR